MKGSSCCSARAVSFSYHSPTKETSPDVGWSTMLALRYRLLPEIPSQGEPAQKTCVASSGDRDDARRRQLPRHRAGVGPRTRSRDERRPSRHRAGAVPGTASRRWPPSKFRARGVASMVSLPTAHAISASLLTSLILTMSSISDPQFFLRQLYPSLSISTAIYRLMGSLSLRGADL